NEDLRTVPYGEEQLAAVAGPERTFAARSGNLLAIAQLRISLYVDFCSTREVRLVRHPMPVWRYRRRIVAEVVLHEDLHIGQSIDRHLFDDALDARGHFYQQQLFAVCRPTFSA